MATPLHDLQRWYKCDRSRAMRSSRLPPARRRRDGLRHDGRRRSGSFGEPARSGSCTRPTTTRRGRLPGRAVTDANVDERASCSSQRLRRLPVFCSTAKRSGLVVPKSNGLLPFAPMAQALADVPEEPDWLLARVRRARVHHPIRGTPKGREVHAPSSGSSRPREQAARSWRSIVAQAGVSLLSEDAARTRWPRSNGGSTERLDRPTHAPSSPAGSRVVIGHRQAIRHCEERGSRCWS